MINNSSFFNALFNADLNPKSNNTKIIHDFILKTFCVNLDSKLEKLYFSIKCCINIDEKNMDLCSFLNEVFYDHLDKIYDCSINNLDKFKCILCIHISQVNFDLFDRLLQQVDWQFICSEVKASDLTYYIYKRSSDNSFVALRIDNY